MTNERWTELERTGKGLTKEEKDAGFHWCYDWDLMLVGPDMEAWKACTCFK